MAKTKVRKVRRKGAAKKARIRKVRQAVPDVEVVARRNGEVRFDYIKGNYFRVIHADGAHGGLTPNGKTIHMSIFNERNAIPQEQTYKLQDGRLGKKLKEMGRNSIVRELEADIVMETQTARAIRDWLTRMLDAAQAVKKESE